jgi:hypothetical protein
VGVEIISQGADMPILHFDSHAAKYVKALAAKPVLGEARVLVGQVRTLYYQPNCALVEPEDGPGVKVMLTPDDFEEVRMYRHKWGTLAFHGRPRLRLGAETLAFREFEANRVVL